MNIRPSIQQHNASLSIEELITPVNNHQHNWLLSYLDVFVLIIMLVLTLMALNDFNTAPSLKKQTLLASPKSSLTQTHLNITKKSTQNDYHYPTGLNKTSPTKIVSINKNILFSEVSKQSIILFGKPPSPIYNNVPETPPIKEENTLLAEKNIYPIASPLPPKINHPQSSITPLQKQLTKTIKQLSLNDAVNIKINQDYAQLEIQDKILFQSSQSILLNAGEVVLKKLAPLLEQSLGLIYIEGHTDNLPIKTIRFPSNWELGAARATSVLHYLITQEIDSSRLRAITFGDTQPVANNLTKEGREKNRRVSITIKISNDRH